MNIFFIISIIFNIIFLIFNIIEKRITTSEFKKNIKDIDAIGQNMKTILQTAVTINNNVIKIEKSNIDRYIYLFDEFSKYLKQKDKFLIDQIDIIVNPDKNIEEHKKEKKDKKSKNNEKQTYSFNINDILDKISLKGINNLTEEEKDFLKNYNKNKK